MPVKNCNKCGRRVLWHKDAKAGSKVYCYDCSVKDRKEKSK